MAKNTKGKGKAAKTKDQVKEAAPEEVKDEVQVAEQEAPKEPEKAPESKEGKEGKKPLKRRPLKENKPRVVYQDGPAKRMSDKKKVDSVQAGLLKFPADKWGVTKDVKKAFVQMVSRIAGDERKKAVVDETLAVLMGHYEAKYKRDHEYKQERLAEAIAEAEARKAAKPE